MSIGDHENVQKRKPVNSKIALVIMGILGIAFILCGMSGLLTGKFFFLGSFKGIGNVFGPCAYLASVGAMINGVAVLLVIRKGDLAYLMNDSHYTHATFLGSFIMVVSAFSQSFFA